MRLKKTAELMSDTPKVSQWGEWIFQKSNLALKNTSHDYYIELTKLNSNAEILDSIFQVSGKKWADTETIFNLIKALDAILNPQANCCSLGKDKKFSGKQLANKFREKSE